MGQPPKQERTASQSLKAVLGVRDLVFSGEIAPGERLSEVNISERLGISRTPVRAALARLEQEGILEAIPSGGYSVRAFTEADVADAIELRGVLEGTAARLAAERGVAPARLAQFKAIVSEARSDRRVPVEQLDFNAYEDLNAQFHQMLAELSGSRIIQREIEHVTQLPFAGPSAFLNAQTDIPGLPRLPRHRPGPPPRDRACDRDARGARGPRRSAASMRGLPGRISISS
jgi:GntR family transcriptional regulator, vanillate catabolism transcriptional regulator